LGFSPRGKQFRACQAGRDTTSQSSNSFAKTSDKKHAARGLRPPPAKKRNLALHDGHWICFPPGRRTKPSIGSQLHLGHSHRAPQARKAMEAMCGARRQSPDEKRQTRQICDRGSALQVWFCESVCFRQNLGTPHWECKPPNVRKVGFKSVHWAHAVRRV